MNSLIAFGFTILDILIYKFTPYESFLFLISLTLFDKKDYFKVIMLGIFIDFVVLNTFFINTIILLILFIFDKSILKIKNKKIKSYMVVNTLNYLIYSASLYLIFSQTNLKEFFLDLGYNYLFNLIFWKKAQIKLTCMPDKANK